MLYSPRDKILAVGLIIEAFLYEEQTRRGLSLRHFDAMNDLADHCTICHRCLKPCPVDIDFGDVTIRLRDILQRRKQRKTGLQTRVAMAFLNATDPRLIHAMRLGMARIGFAAQRHTSQALRSLGLLPLKRRPGTTNQRASIPAQAVHFLDKPMPADIPQQGMRQLIGAEESDHIPIIRDPERTDDNSEAVFYFPGCGPERLFSQVGLATLAMLHDAGVKTVLPPGYMCCGYPQHAGGYIDRAKAMTTANRVLLHRVANTLNYLDIQTVVVSCGTCLTQLERYEFQRIFPGCRLIDIHELLLEKGYGLEASEATQYLYHDPCHTPIKTQSPTGVASRLMGQPVQLSDRCCGESGVFAISRPDIAGQVGHRKQEEIHKGVEALTGAPRAEDGNVRMLTTCPSCLEGLSRYRADTGVEADYIVTEMARRLLGERWQEDFLQRTRRGSMEKVLL